MTATTTPEAAMVDRLHECRSLILARAAELARELDEWAEVVRFAEAALADALRPPGFDEQAPRLVAMARQRLRRARRSALAEEPKRRTVWSAARSIREELGRLPRRFDVGDVARLLPNLGRERIVGGLHALVMLGEIRLVPAGLGGGEQYLRTAR